MATPLYPDVHLVAKEENMDRDRVCDFIEGFTLETTPKAAERISDHREYLEPGTTVAITCLPGTPFEDTLRTATRLVGQGFRPVPHITARSIVDRTDLETRLRALKDAGIKEVVLLAGGQRQALGIYENSMQLLETGLFEAYGIERIGIAGHPEGSPDISPNELASALAWKNDYARSSIAEFYICTQFCFEAQPVIAWDEAIRAAGNHLPVRVGIPGPATIRTLLRHAKDCGIGPSMRVLTRQARNVARLVAVKAPDRLIIDLAAYMANDPDCGIINAHFYPLGDWKKTVAWAYAVRNGKFQINPDGSGFAVAPITQEALLVTCPHERYHF